LKNSLNYIFNSQINLVKKASKFLNIKNNKYYDSSLNYLDTLEPTPGYGLVQFWHKGIKKIPLLVFLIFKDFILSFYDTNFIVIKKKKKKKFKNIIISWSKKKNFLKNGSYNDQYFNVNSSQNKKDYIWFLIHMDNELPKKVDRNIVIIKKNGKKFNIKKFLFFFFNFYKLFFYFKEIIHKNSIQTKIAYEIFECFKELLQHSIKKIILPYESQVFQNLIINKIKVFDKKIKTIGVIHNFPAALPTNLIYREGCPEKIIVNGMSQKKCFIKYLSWKKKQIVFLPSSRFVNKKKNMAYKIFLPGHIISPIFILNLLKKILLLYEDINFNNFEIKNHPQKLNSTIHLHTIKEIRNLLKEKKYKSLNNKKRVSIFIGSSSAIIEALECNCSSVIQITEDNLLHVYNKKFFPNLKSKLISNNILEYTLSKKNELIKFGKKKHTFKEYLKN